MTSRWRRRLSLVGPYLAVCAVVIVGLFADADDNRRIERESIRRDRAICQDGNRRAAGVITYTERLLDYFGVEGDEREALRDLATESFPQETCPSADPG